MKANYKQDINRKNTKIAKDRLLTIYRNYYINMFNNIFVWYNFPTTGNLKYFLQAICFEGRASFFKDDDGGILSLKNCDAGAFNIYGYPTNTKNIGFNFVKDGKTYIAGADNQGVNTVVCYHTPIRYVRPINIIDYFANKIVELLLMYNTKVIQAKRPFIISATEEQKKEMTMVLEDIINDNSIIVGSDALSSIPLQVLPTGVRVSDVKEVTELVNIIDNEFKEFFGINNNKQFDKKERLIVDEINNNNTSTNLVLDMMLQSRKTFCNQVNEVWGINIDVNVNPCLNDNDRGDMIDDKDTVQGVES